MYVCVILDTALYSVCVWDRERDNFGLSFSNNLDSFQENEGGFLKLKRTSEWLLGDNNSAPMNKKMSSKVVYMLNCIISFINSFTFARLREPIWMIYRD